jgi:hypothetical protein
VVVPQPKFSLYFALPGSPILQTLLTSNVHIQLSFSTAMDKVKKPREESTKKGVEKEQTTDRGKLL